VRTAFRLVLWWVVLWGLWLLYVGQHHAEEVVAGAIAAALSLGVGVAIARLGAYRYRVDGRRLARAWSLPWNVVRDFGLISLALLRGRPNGVWQEVEFPVGGDDARAAGRRALAGMLGSIAPNAYVVDFDAKRNVALVHRLDPRRGGDEPL
jgi:multisubunit Na+/H+ antiporter MnhE subunit